MEDFRGNIYYFHVGKVSDSFRGNNVLLLWPDCGMNTSLWEFEFHAESNISDSFRGRNCFPLNIAGLGDWFRDIAALLWGNFRDLFPQNLAQGGINRHPHGVPSSHHC
uniref:Uncharacterized protein n=1 Tax=Cacopsylla melanoneura TaxID=428564 RepID=A0A8D8LV23_9HEMI